MKKYEFTGETKEVQFLLRTVVLHRIRALVAFANVNVGEVGGWIEKEENLSHEASAWVCGNAKVYGDANVCGNANVYGDANVHGGANVCGNAKVYGDANVCGNANVYGDANVHGGANVCGNAKVFSPDSMLTVTPVGSCTRCATFFRTKDKTINVTCSWFLGNLEEFKSKYVQESGCDKKQTKIIKKACKLAEKWIDLESDSE